LSPGIDANTAKNYKYKISIDTRNNKTLMKVQRDINDGNGYNTLINWTNITQNGTPTNFKLSFTGSTGDSKNIHSIDNLKINATNCGTLGKIDIPIPQSFFNAWDIFRDISDRHISTKIVNQDFNLTIASLDENGTNYQDFNGTVCAVVDNAISKLLFKNQNKIDVTFKISRAIKDARVHLSWKKNVYENCPKLMQGITFKSNLKLLMR